MILGNKHATLEGRRVTQVVKTTHRALMPSFPGWGKPDEFEHFAEVEIGDEGTITRVESHGNNPWTRFSVQWDNGNRSHGVHPGDVEVGA